VSVALHVGYEGFLMGAYRLDDRSQVYPAARMVRTVPPEQLEQGAHCHLIEAGAQPSRASALTQPVGEWSCGWPRGRRGAAARAEPGDPPDEGELLGFTAERLAPFKRPRLVRYVDAPPRNALSKVLKPELRA
jgi:acyl-CoA synthetase (AMP-forming)/AMP-acid ligase II